MLQNRFIKRIFAYFVRGLVLVAPTYFTFLIIKEGISYLDSILPIYIHTDAKHPLYLPGLGLSIIVSSIVFLGFIFSRFVPQSVFSFSESILKKMPLVSLIYYSIKDLISAFVGDKRKFNQPVLITINPQSDLKKLGFITQNDLSSRLLSTLVRVFRRIVYCGKIQYQNSRQCIEYRCHEDDCFGRSFGKIDLQPTNHTACP
jgi:uncharacterized membrane protein